MAVPIWTDFTNIKENTGLDPTAEKFDVNSDGSVDVSDITSIANYILNGKAKVIIEEIEE